MSWRWLAAVPVTWASHLVLSYLLVALHCEDGWLPGSTAIRVVLVAVTLGAAAVAVVSALRLRTRADASGDSGEGTIAFVGLLLSVAFGTYLLWSLIPDLIIRTCAQ
ncbi:MAG: hypothetical protein ACJ762_03025 [Solirubrobacteraceae bacterium]